MDQSRIKQLQAQLVQFVRSDKKCFTFHIDCDISDRIKFIYRVIFPGCKKYKFYVRFFIARVARMIDISAVKILLYRSIGVSIGKGVFISPDVFIDPHFPHLIELGDYCILGWGAHLFTHECSGKRYRLGRISVGPGAVIGAHTTIRSGVAIDAMAEVLYGSIVYKDIRSCEEVSLRKSQIKAAINKQAHVQTE